MATRTPRRGSDRPRPRPPHVVHPGARHHAPRESPPDRGANRFRDLDTYRAAREWQRLEGTPQRDLFRELRERFLDRHRVDGGWAADIGSGPGRFAPGIGGTSSRTVLVDVSAAMLAEARHRGIVPGARFRLLLADARQLPLRPRSMMQVVLLGNALGFAEDAAPRLGERAMDLVAPGGTFVAEIVPGHGERSRYLTRLPPGAVQRLLEAPINAVRPRLEREGFRAEPAEAEPGAFRRTTFAEFRTWLTVAGLEVVEVMAVAPALGNDAGRIAAVRASGRSWRHLVELEEAIGRGELRHDRANALLVAARRPFEGTAGAGTPERAIK